MNFESCPLRTQDLESQPYKLPKIPSNNYIDYMTSTIITHTSTPTVHNQTLDELKYVFEHLRLENFKTTICKVKIHHNFKKCPFYHNNADRRRLGTSYSSEFCEQMAKNGHCEKNDQCEKSHNLIEQLYSPDQYKTKFCSFYPNNLEACDYGRYCSFAHYENELLVELIHNLIYDEDFFIFLYKTIWCPFSFFQHDKNLCVYAHNFQDFRRKPINNKYTNSLCSTWNECTRINNYQDGCPNDTNCEKSHGWFEFQFHPLNYKTKECENKNECQCKVNCPFYHDQNDKRTLPQELIWNMFKLVPKNRIVSKTFKTNKNENIYFEINQKTAKNLFFNQRALTNKNKNNKPGKMNKVHSFSQMESNIAPFYYEPAAIESKASIKFIPKPREIENNQWFRQNILKKTSLEFIDMNRNPNIDNNEEKHVESSYGAPIIDQNLKKEKEHEELLENQLKNMLKNICEEENDDVMTPSGPPKGKK